jgi:hypothetical protein
MRSGAGIALALSAALLFAIGAVVQAAVARRAAPHDALRLSLIARLARSPRWLVGTALTAAAWCLQAGALWLAPVTAVQPAMAATLVLVVVLGRIVLGEPVGRKETAGGAILTAGVAAAVLLAPARSAHAAGAAVLGPPIAALAAFTILPLALRGAMGRRPGALTLAAGAAYALTAVATKLATDSLWSRDLVWCAVWVAVIAACGVAGTVSEMSALQVRSASFVIPLVVTIETLVPVGLAPALFGERWNGLGAQRAAALAGSLGLVAAGVWALAGSVAVGRTARKVTTT